MTIAAPLGVVPSITVRSFRVLSADRVAVIKDGKFIDDMSPEEMIAMARGMIAVANKAIEMRPRVAEAIAKDSAILLRAGVPVGLSSHPKIQDMARSMAVNDRDLRRYMPGGVKSEEQVGTPAVSIHRSKEG